jgi:DNA-binding CsgD family transcriptional regulator
MDMESGNVIGSDGGLLALATDIVAVGLVDARTGAIRAANGAYAELLGRSPQSIEGLTVENYLDPTRAASSRAVLSAMLEGWIESLAGEVEVLRPDGPALAYSWSTALGATPPRNMVLSAATRLTPDGTRSIVVEPERVIVGTLDRTGRIQDIGPGAVSLLEWPLGHGGHTYLHELVHPADQDGLGGALDGSLSNRDRETLDVRLSGRGDRWLNTRLTMSRLYGETQADLAIVGGLAADAARTETDADRINRLEAKLARIGAEVTAAGLMPDGSGTRYAGLAQLTDRQNEIVRRLVDGQRVGSIARDLFISPSTVRNHLSAVYRQLGVDSQSRLIDRLRQRDPL